MKRLILILLASVLLTACGPAEPQTPWLGELNYQAPMAWIEPISTDEGDLLEYREVLDLEGFISSTTVPIVVCVRQVADYAASTVIPQMESWAYEYRAKAEFLFADANAGDPLLQSLDFSVTPTFFLIQNGRVVMQASWQEANALQLLENELISRMNGE